MGTRWYSGQPPDQAQQVRALARLDPAAGRFAYRLVTQGQQA